MLIEFSLCRNLLTLFIDPEWKDRWPDSIQLPYFKETMQNSFAKCHDLHIDIYGSLTLLFQDDVRGRPSEIISYLIII